MLYEEDDDEDEIDTVAPKENKPDKKNTDSKLRKQREDGDGSTSSSSDDNDSTAAAHAAAIGHSPHPLKQLARIPESEKMVDDMSTENDDVLKSQPAQGDVGETPSVGVNIPEDKIHVPENTTAPEIKESTATGEEETAKDSLKKDEKSHSMDVDEDGDHDHIADNDVKINGATSNGCERASLEVDSHKATKLKLNRQIKLNARDEDENTPIHIAIHTRKLEHVKILLEAGASHRMRCDGSAPIHLSISMGAVRAHVQFAYECVVLLHEHGADVTIKDDAVHTPLFLACMFNLPQIVSYILSDAEGLSTLHTRADRAGNRPLHAAAKFDTLENPSVSRTAASVAIGKLGTTDDSTRGYPGKMAIRPLEDSVASTLVPTESAPTMSATASSSTEALLTQVLLNTNGIEVDALNIMGQTALHVACIRRNWPVARLLLQAGASPTIKDRRGLTPGNLAHKRALPIPNDLVDILGGPPESGVVPPLRELSVDPDATTLLLCHDLCILHRTCPPIRRNSAELPPENVRRLQVLIDPENGILRSGEFGNMVWNTKARRAAIADILKVSFVHRYLLQYIVMIKFLFPVLPASILVTLKVHEYSYVEKVSSIASSLPDHPGGIAHLDADTAISRWSFEAAMRAAGSLCEAVDQVMAGDKVRNAFCAVRPPGHHAGPRGIVRCAADPEGLSHGFCLLNNVCIGGAYARSVYRNEGIQKVAIIDFDVHHGNGTEAVIRQLVPTVEKGTIRTPFAVGEISTTSYRPWLDETDVQNVFFASTHGYGSRGFEMQGWFYPASGKTHTSESISNPAMVETPSTEDFILSQTWARMGDDYRMNCCKIINIGLDLPEPDTDLQARNMRQRLELRDSYRKTILPALREFDPDIIFISAGFDAHRTDTMNFGYVGMVEDDYEWVTEQLVKVANTCCNGRVVSVLEGGYKIHGGIVSPFARSVASHVRALVDGGRSRELYDPESGEWESTFERNIYERRERKKEQERDQLRLLEETNRKARLDELTSTGQGDVPEDPDAPTGSRKRRRNQVDYKELFKQMQEEGFAG